MSYLGRVRLDLLAPTAASRLTGLFAVVVSLLFFSTHAGAKQVDWTLSNVTFVGGGTATGSFTFDENPPDPNVDPFLVTWSIAVAGGVIDAFTYEPPDFGLAFPQVLLACGPPDGSPFSRCIAFNLLTQMTDVGGIVTIDPAVSSEFVVGSDQIRGIESGCFTTTGSCVAAVPESSTLLLLGSGLVSVAAALGRRFRHRV